MQGHRCEKLLFSERKLLNAILREKLKSMKYVFSNEMRLFAMQRQISCVRAFLQSNHVRASMNTNAVLVQLSK